MTFSITLDWILNVLLVGLSISLTAFLMPFVYVKNFGTALVVGILISLVNAGIWYLLTYLGVSISTSDSIARALINFLIYTLSIMAVDGLLGGFRVSGFFRAAIFGLLVAVIAYFLEILLAGIV